MDKNGPLPPGYEAKWDHGQKAYFYINHNDKTTTWIDPRTTIAAQARPRIPQKALTPRNYIGPDFSKLKQMFPDCPDEILQSVLRSCENNVQTAVNQLAMLGFKESRIGTLPCHSTIKQPSENKQHKIPTRKSTQPNEFATGADPVTNASTSTSNMERTRNSYAGFTTPSGQIENGSTHLVTNTSKNQGITDLNSAHLIRETSTAKGITDTSTAQGITGTSTVPGIVSTITNQGSTDISFEEGRTESNNRTSPSKAVNTSTIKDETPVHTKKSVAVGQNRALQNGPDPTLRLREHLAANGHDPSLMQGPDSSLRSGSTGWVGADSSLFQKKTTST